MRRGKRLPPPPPPPPPPLPLPPPPTPLPLLPPLLLQPRIKCFLFCFVFSYLFFFSFFLFRRETPNTPTRPGSPQPFGRPPGGQLRKRPQVHVIADIELRGPCNWPLTSRPGRLRAAEVREEVMHATACDLLTDSLHVLLNELESRGFQLLMRCVFEGKAILRRTTNCQPLLSGKLGNA